MRAFLSKFLLSIFIVVFALPASLFAQTDWVPPTGGPTTPGTNTPAPLNVGPQGQTKAGALMLMNGLNVKGPTLLNDNGSPMNNFFLSFNPAWFTDSVNIGVPFLPGAQIGADLNVFGNIRYVPASVGGVESGPQPVRDSVLKSADEDGNLVWGAAMPDGNNNGDTLIWDTTCNCWVTGPGGGGGTGLPSATDGQTLWYNGGTGQWEATSQIERWTVGSDQFKRTRLRDPYVHIMGPIIDIGSNNSLAPGLDPVSPIYGLNIGTRTTRIKSNNVEIGSSSTPASLYTSGQQNKTDIYSNNVNFLSSTNNPQNVTFNSNAVKFKGPTSNPGLFDAGAGRIPYSVDNDGTFKWNRNLAYSEFEIIPGLNAGQLTLANPQNGIGVFANQGITWLQDNTVISQEGDLFLEGLDGGTYTQWAAGQIKHLCYVEGSFKVVSCPPTSLPGDAPINPGTVTPIGVGGIQGDGTIMFTSEDNGSQFNFNFNGTVEVTYCGGGGGGGGGGIGSPGEGGVNGTGGSGGGGGAAGQCRTESIDVQNGDVLTWNIGNGGAGGSGAAWVQSSGNPQMNQDNNAFSGQIGGNTSIFFDPTSGPEVQVGPTVNGGFGGNPGGSVRQGLINGLPVIGTHGNSSLSSGSFAWGFNGSAGGTNVTAPCESCGGIGGWGESYDSDGNLRTGLNGNQTSARGGGGTPGGTDSMSDRLGKAGYCGSPRHGGGGGGGGFGNVYRPNLFTFTYKGGNGGCGGSGYVLIYGLPNTNSNTNEIVYSTPGTFSLTTFQENNVIPAGVENFTIEIWGAGGGAGGVNTGTNYRSGGGGSGEYKKITMSRQNLFNASFVVGASGANGVNNSGVNSVTSGAKGGQSMVGASIARGGWGGYGGNTFNYTIPPRFGKGGGWTDDLDDSFTWPNEGYSLTSNSATYNRGSEGSAPVSGSSMGPCNLAGEAVALTLGFGGGAPRSCTDPTLNIYQGQAQNGRIRISW